MDRHTNPSNSPVPVDMTAPPGARPYGARLKLWIGLAILAFFITGIAGGVAGALWFTQHYQVVAKSPTPIKATNPPLTGPQTPTPQPVSALVTPGTTPQGPFQVHFTPNEVASYRIDTQIGGEGKEAGSQSPITLNFVSDFSMLTKSVGADGSADLRLAFDNATMTGTFMDVPYEMGYSKDRTYMFYGNTSLDTAQGGQTTNIPQLEFFKTPISMHVGANGQVEKLEGPDGFAGMLTAIPSLTTLEFPTEEMQAGRQWETEFAMPLPGIGTPVKSKITNTFVGYETLENKYCGVVKQTFGADQTNGTINQPPSALGEQLNLSLPTFELHGENMIYFDISNGQLVHAKLDMQLTMGISKMINDLTKALGMFTEGQDTDPLGLDDATKPNLLDLDVKIQGALTRIEPKTPPVQ